jgi:hypothetical protein
LTQSQKTCFRTTLAELAATPGWIQRVDRACLVAFAIHSSNFRAAQKHRDLEGDMFNVLDKNGQVIGQRVSEWVHVAQKESELAMKLQDRLGLNPSSRETSHVEPPKPPGFDWLTPPRSSPPLPHVTLERTLSLTETLVQETEAPGLFDPVPVVEVSTDPVVPVLESPAAAAVVESDDVATVEPGPAGVPLEAPNVQGEAVAEAPVRKKTLDPFFSRFP